MEGAVRWERKETGLPAGSGAWLDRRAAPPAVERGFRRLTVVCSIAILCITLLLTPYVVYVLWRASLRDECVRSTIELIDRLHVSAPQAISGMYAQCPDDPFKKRDGVVATALEGGLLAVGALALLIERVGVASLLPTGATESYGFVVGTFLVANVVVGLVLAAVPWSAFYLMRWIARGFRD